MKMTRYIATEREDGYFISDIKSNDFQIVTKEDYFHARDFIKMDLMYNEKDGLRENLAELLCMGLDNINIDARVFSQDNTLIFSIDSSNNVNIYNVTDIEGNVRLLGTSNVNLYMRYGSLSLVMDTVNTTTIKGIYKDIEDLDLILTIYNGMNIPDAVTIEGIKRIRNLTLKLDMDDDEGLNYVNWYSFYYTSNKIIVDKINTSFMTVCLYTHLVDTIEGKSKLVSEEGRLNFYLYDYNDAEFDLTVFDVSKEGLEAITQLTFCNGYMETEDANIANITVIVDDINKYEVLDFGAYNTIVTMRDEQNKVVYDFSK